MTNEYKSSTKKSKTVADVVQELPEPNVHAEMTPQQMWGSNGSDIHVPACNKNSLAQSLEDIPAPIQPLDTTRLHVPKSKIEQFRLAQGKPFSFPENFVESLAGTERPITDEEWAHIHELSYMECYILDLMRDGAVANYLNTHGHANATVCPECHVDDFFHVEGCSHQID